MSLVSILAMAAMLASPATADGCHHPAPAAGFNNTQYKGVWYEIAKIQTAGGAAFEKNCVCTQLNVRDDPGAASGNLLVDNLCRMKTPSGQLSNFTGTLENESPPGRWEEVRTQRHAALLIRRRARPSYGAVAEKTPMLSRHRAQSSPLSSSQSFFAGIPGVNYTVILTGTEGEDTYAVEYDCGDPFGIPSLTNYCIHVLARRPKMAPALLTSLVGQALDMGLNDDNLNLTHTLQDGCWNSPTLRGSLTRVHDTPLVVDRR